MVHEEMMGMLALKDPCADPPGMSFHPDNPTELAPGAEGTLNVIGGVPPYTFEILQTSLFYFDDSFITWPYLELEASVVVTSYFNVNYLGINAAQSTSVRHNGSSGNAWVSANGQPSEQRFNIDFGEAKIVDQIMIENLHESGDPHTWGIKNFDFQGSNDANALNQVDYSSDQYWTNVQTGLQAAPHQAINFDDPQIFDIDNETAYRYYSLKIADNWGYASYMGFRHVQFHTARKKVYAYETNTPQIIVKAPDYALWTPRIKCTDLCNQVAEAWLYCTPGKWDHDASSASGGTPELCGGVNFRAIGNGVMIACTNCNTNGLGASGMVGHDCSHMGGGYFEVSVSEKCEGGSGCTHVQNREFWCWPYPS